MRKRSNYVAICPNEQCELHGSRDHGNIAPHGLESISWNTVSRWIDRVAQSAKGFDRAMTRGFVLRELSACAAVLGALRSITMFH